MSSKLSLVSLIILLSIISTNPVAHGQILTPIVSQILPTVCNTVPSIVGQSLPTNIVSQPLPVNITILGSLSCSSANVLGPGMSGVNVTIICGNIILVQTQTNNQGLLNVTVNTNTNTLFRNTSTLSCVARVGLPVPNCTLIPISTGTLQGPILGVGNIIQNAIGLVITAVIGLLSSIVQ